MDWPLLEVLTDEERRDLFRVARRRRFRRGEVIFHEGDPGDTLHLLAKGHVAIRITTPLGDVATLQILAAGDYFGELAVVAPAPRNATIVALDEVETLGLHRDQIEELRDRSPMIDRFLMNALITEVRRLSAQLAEALYVGVDKRIWRRLLDLARIYRAPDAALVSIPLTQEDLAQLAGTTRPTVNRVLRAAEQSNIITLGRAKIDIHDLDALTRHAR